LRDIVTGLTGLGGFVLLATEAPTFAGQARCLALGLVLIGLAAVIYIGPRKIKRLTERGLHQGAQKKLHH